MAPPQLQESWRKKIYDEGFIDLAKIQPLLLPADLENSDFVWCFCDFLFLGRRFNECPGCGISKEKVVVK